MPRKTKYAPLAAHPPPRPAAAAPARSPPPQTAPRPAAAARTPSPPKTAPRPAPAPPQTVHHYHVAPARSSGGFFSSIADGWAFGTGNAMGHRAVDCVTGPPTVKHETVVSEAAAPAPAPAATAMGDACGSQSKAFLDCLNSSLSDIVKCQLYMDKLVECSGNSHSVVQSKAFLDCLDSSRSDIGKCQLYMDRLAECSANSDYVMSSLRVALLQRL